MVQAEVRPIVTEATIVGRNWRRKAVPTYSVHEVAKTFFGMSSSWVRLKLNPDENHPNTWFTHENGDRIEFRRRTPKTTGKTDPARLFLLSDIEPMARSLFRFAAIDGRRLALILKVVKAEADLFGLLEEERQRSAAQGDAAKGDA